MRKNMKTYYKMQKLTQQKMTFNLKRNLMMRSNLPILKNTYVVQRYGKV